MAPRVCDDEGEKALPQTLDEWQAGFSAILARTKSGKATGPDAISYELLKASGADGARAWSQLCVKVAREGAPLEWRGGCLFPVPRKSSMPLSRAVLCSSCPGKIYAATLRRAAIPWMHMWVGQAQSGAVPHGGTDFAVMTVRCYLLASARSSSSGGDPFRRPAEGLLLCDGGGCGRRRHGV